ncbi:unnamed protein product [Brassica napus]|uniref:(rape) hypothetical protein n=1 Tax=Brassica napus TaxID=3708 RepID=A0A816Q0J6_BRANA|nr:unnamed protein product [Brassica napus]
MAATSANCSLETQDFQETKEKKSNTMFVEVYSKFQLLPFSYYTNDPESMTRT